jgi:RND family efflux transporter MFP subunit
VVAEENGVRLLLIALVATAALGQETVAVVSKAVDRKSRLPGELLPYQTVDLRARVAGFVEKVTVDRGSVVKKGDLLVELDAPEMRAQLAEAQAKVQALEAQRAELDARRVAAESVYDRMKNAAQTPGAISQNEVVQAEKVAEAARGSIAALDGSIRSSRASVQVIQDLQAYLKVTAPFDGIIVERWAHPGALAGPSMNPLLKLEQNSRLRLVVAVPETEAGAIVRSAHVAFTVPAFPGQHFSGVVVRLPRSMDAKTRTMPVEADVDNSSGRLAPGMYPEVEWPSRSGRAALLVPPTAIVTTTERTFVIRVSDGRAEWVDVRKGSAAGELVEVLGPLKEGDRVVRRGSDELRPGTPVK